MSFGHSVISVGDMTIHAPSLNLSVLLRLIKKSSLSEKILISDRIKFANS